jgi:hypothetical protein
VGTVVKGWRRSGEVAFVVGIQSWLLLLLLLLLLMSYVVKSFVAYAAAGPGADTARAKLDQKIVAAAETCIEIIEWLGGGCPGGHGCGFRFRSLKGHNSRICALWVVGIQVGWYELQSVIWLL